MLISLECSLECSVKEDMLDSICSFYWWVVGACAPTPINKKNERAYMEENNYDKNTILLYTIQVFDTSLCHKYFFFDMCMGPNSILSCILDSFLYTSNKSNK